MNSILNIYTRFFNYAYATREPEHSGNTTKRLSELCKVFLPERTNVLSTALSSRNTNISTTSMFQLPPELLSFIINNCLLPKDRLNILFTSKLFGQLLINKHFLSAPKIFKNLAEFNTCIECCKPTDTMGFEVKLTAMLTERQPMNFRRIILW